ncbi:hypothetical protein [Endozoicomonas atrinae]|uniref:hypothetical protein n=1 Tax=Endozoicomonas atrinae TaxID=1333660 RepID=UPI003AFFB7A6
MAYLRYQSQTFRNASDRVRRLFFASNTRNDHNSRLNRKGYENHFSSEAALPQLALEIATSDLLGKNPHTFISITNLVAGIVDLANKSESSNVELKDILYQLASRATCTAPVWTNGNVGSGVIEEDDSNEDEDITKRLQIDDQEL